MKYHKSITTTILICCLFAPLAFGQDGNAEREGAFYSLLNSKSVEGTWDEDTGSPRSIGDGEVALASYPGLNGKSASEQYFEDTNNILGIGDPELEIVFSAARTSRNGKRGFFIFNQLYQGIPVVGGGYTVGVTLENDRTLSGGDIHFIQGPFYAGIKVGTTPQIGIQEAESVALSSPEIDSDLRIINSELVVRPSGSKEISFDLAYRVYLQSQTKGVEVFVDAKDSQILFVNYTGSRASSHAEHLNVGHSTSQSFLVNSVNWSSLWSSSIVTNEGLVYETVADEGSLAVGDLTNLTVPGIYDDWELRGDYADMRYEYPDTTSYITGNTGTEDEDFYYSGTTNDERGRVNTYYHVNNFVDSYGVTPDEEYRVVSYAAGTSVSILSPNSTSYASLQGSTSSFNDANEIADLIIHEYFHLLSHQENNSINDGGTWADAVWEGLSDFVGMLYLSDEGSSKTVWGHYWFIENQTPYSVREVDNTWDYDDWDPSTSDLDQNDIDRSPYDLGLVLAGALWEYWDTGTASDSDKWDAMYDAISGFGSDVDPWDVLPAMKATSSCNSTCDSELDTIFSARGLKTDPRSNPPIPFFEGEEVEVAKSAPAIEISAYPNPFNPTTSIRLDLQERGFTQVTIHDVLGREVATIANGTLKAGTHQFRWDASAYSSGVYLLRVQSAGNVYTQSIQLLK